VDERERERERERGGEAGSDTEASDIGACVLLCMQERWTSCQQTSRHSKDY
jgi:hypothetical protein